MKKNDELTNDKLVELREYLEKSIAFRRKAQRTRKNAGLHQEWIDGKISGDIKRDCYRLAFVDQVLASGVIR
jgi:hypothetical protein